MGTNESLPKRIPKGRVIARDGGIVRLCTGTAARVIYVSEGELLTLSDCEKLAKKELGYGDENDATLLVVAEYETIGTVYKYGNHFDKKGNWIWEKVGDTVGYA